MSQVPGHSSAIGPAQPDRRYRFSSNGAEFVDRWIWVFTAALFVAVALAAFIPDSIARIEAVRSGTRPPFPAVLHVHAVLMGSWLCLLLAQTVLMATGRPLLHRKLGLLSFLLVPAIVIAGFLLVQTTYLQVWDAVQNPPPGSEERLANRLVMRNDILLLQLRTGIAFPILVFIGLAYRRSDPETHKRLMILSIAIAMTAATGRLTWLPQSFPESAASRDIYALLLVTPMFLWDLYRRRKVHRAYIIWLLITAPAVTCVYLLWGSQWWLSNAPRLMGLA